MNETDVDEAVFTLLRFYEAMHRWGMSAIEFGKTVFADEDDRRQHHDALLSKFRMILDEYTTPQNRSMRSSDEAISYDHRNPEFDPDKIEVLHTESFDDSIEVTLQEAYGMHWIMKYRLYRIGDGWKIGGDRQVRTKNGKAFRKIPL
ncbi:MAG: hypothetical protein KDB00_00510 [Planctomycetales bacterium]|nr:hypothetical protein [Planctomycetales bacterium]